MLRKNSLPGAVLSVLVIVGMLALTAAFPLSAGKVALKFVSLGAFVFVPSGEKAEGTASEEKESGKSEKKKASVSETSLKTASKASALTETDKDIKKLIADAEKKASGDKKDGAISEEDLHDGGRTASFENVNVKNTNKTQIDIEQLLTERAELSVTKKKEQPAVLIYHTHTTEAFQILDRNFYAVGFKPRSSSPSMNMVRVGDAICERLQNAGFSVIHDTEIYDTAYTGAYYRSYDAAKAWMEKYPSIQITLDIHRDAIQYNSGTKVKPTAVIGGKKAAQIMIISGCQEEGNGIEDFPDWRKNLVFALHLQKTLEDSFPGVTRPVFFCARDYNMNLTPCSLLIEIGTDANTLEEAVYSGKLLGEGIAALMKGYIKK